MTKIRFSKEYVPVGHPKVKFPKMPKANIKRAPKFPKPPKVNRLDRFIK